MIVKTTTFVALALFLVVSVECKVGKFHVLQTHADTKTSKSHTLDDLREYTRQHVRQQSQERRELADTFDGSGGTVVTEPTTLVVYFTNPSNAVEDIVIRDFLTDQANIENWNIHHESTTFTPEEYDSLSEAEAAFFRATEEGRTAIMMGDAHSSSSGISMKWLDPTEMDNMPKIDVANIPQISAMVLKVSPNTIFSVTLTFSEEVSADVDVSTVKELFSTHMSFEVGPQGTALKGMVESPDYPNAYPDNANMRYLIHMPIEHNYGIQFTLDEIDTEQCCDRLILYDGVTTSAQVVGMYSGSIDENPNAVVTTQSSDLLVQFQSDCYKSAGKYSFTFESKVTGETLTCEPSTNIAGDAGTLTSAGYPIDYPSSSDCKWVITTSAGTWTTLELVDMDLTARDVVSVFYFPDANNPNQDVVLAEYSGNMTANVGEILVAETNSLTVRLISQVHEIPRRGFSFNWATTKPPTACGGGIAISEEDEGIIQSDNYPLNYFSNSSCVWQVQVDDNSIVGINIKDFATELRFDWLYIYDGPDDTSPLLAEVSGTNGQDRIYFTTQPYVFIRFQSDGNTNDRGFLIEWYSYVQYQDCVSGNPIVAAPTVEAKRGFIATPNFPEPFDGFSDCEHIVKTEENTAVHLTITNLDFGFNNTNRLLIYDGPTNHADESRVIFDSYNLIIPEGNFILNATQNEMFVDFTSDNDNEIYTGFAAYFSQIPLNMCPANQANQLGRIPQGVITSPLYPGYFPPSITSCAWHIRTRVGTFVTIQTNYFHIGELDSVTFSNGDGTPGVIGNNQEITRCSGVSCPEYFRSQNNSMFILFESQGSHPGFEFSYYSSPTGCASSTETLTNARGYVTSTNYPFNYNPNENCEWSVIAGIGDIIRFHLNFMDTEADNDYLLVVDETNNVVVANYSGYTLPHTFDTGRRATISFHSNSQAEYKGFELYYEALLPKQQFTNETIEYTCSGTDTVVVTQNERNRIYSQQFPTGYPANLDYCWTFIADHKSTFTFDFSRFDTESIYDVVNIYRGASTSNVDLVDSYSGLLGSFTAVVPNQQSVTVIFHSDVNFNGDGFILDYSFADVIPN